MLSLVYQKFRFDLLFRMPTTEDRAIPGTYSAASEVSGFGDRKRNILVFSSIFLPHVFGGGEVASYNRAKLLAGRGHHVSVVTLRERDAPSSWGNSINEPPK